MACQFRSSRCRWSAAASNGSRNPRLRRPETGAPAGYPEAMVGCAVVEFLPSGPSFLPAEVRVAVVQDAVLGLVEPSQARP